MRCKSYSELTDFDGVLWYSNVEQTPIERIDPDSIVLTFSNGYCNPSFYVFSLSICLLLLFYFVALEFGESYFGNRDAMNVIPSPVWW